LKKKEFAENTKILDIQISFFFPVLKPDFESGYVDWIDYKAFLGD
jgi:hypothetical protein